MLFLLGLCHIVKAKNVWNISKAALLNPEAVDLKIQNRPQTMPARTEM